LPAAFFVALVGVVVLYGLSAEAAKRFFYRFYPLGQK
jgi:hypothetical protein